MKGRNSRTTGPEKASYVSGMVLASAMGFVQCAAADARQFDVPPGDASTTLLSFARQSGLQLLFDYNALKDVRTHAVSGRFEPEAALAEMLRGTGFRFERTNPRSFSIRPADHGGAGRAPPPHDTVLAANSEPAPPLWVQPQETAESKQGAGGGDLPAMLVTARRRTESIQDVPVSLTAISGDTLSRFGASGFSDYAGRIPNLSFGIGGGAGGNGSGYGVSSTRAVTIRGVAGNNTTSFYINDTPVPLSLDPRILDVDRLEVLRGPQGTLFGASSMGGTVRIITREPDFNGVQGRIEAQGYNLESAGFGYELAGVGNVPLVSDTLALRVAAYHSETPGFFSRSFGNVTVPGIALPPGQSAGVVRHVADERESGALANMSFRPRGIEGLTVSALAIFQQSDSNGLPLADNNPSNFVQTRPLDVPEQIRDTWGFGSLTAKYELPIGRIISATTYFDRRALDVEDGTDYVASYYSYVLPQFVPSPARAQLTTKTFTEEDRFESSFGGPVDFVAGVFYQHTDRKYDEVQYTPGATALTTGLAGGFTSDFYYSSHSPNVDEQIAGFADVTAKPAAPIEVSAGVRVARLRHSYIYRADGFANGGPSLDTGTHRESSVAPRVTGKYQLSPDAMLYATAAKGFRGGGQNFSLPPVCDAEIAALGFSGRSIPFSSDSLWSYEVGAKNTWLGGKLASRVAAYHIDWTKIQQTQLLQCTYAITVNSGAAASDGGEFELETSPLAGLNVGLGLGFEQAKITKASATSLSRVGQPLNGVPKWTANANAEYTVPVAIGSAFLRAEYSYTGRSVSFNNDPVNGLARASYSLVDLRLGAASGGWEISAFAKNLFNVRANLSDEISEIGSVPGRVRIFVNRPRMIGLALVRKF